MTTQDASRPDRGIDAPLISVVIPTAGRAAKLRYTLDTVLSQEHATFEVIVHDNYSTDGTVDVLAERSDSRLRSFRTSERLSMTENWEAAVSKINGEYVLIIGDDDAILPGGLAYLQDCIARYGAGAYWWKCASYNWPKANEDAWIELLPMKANCRVLRTRRIVKAAARTGGMLHQRLPLLYHSLVRTDVLSAVRKRLGRVFDTTCPDLFSGFALPPFLGEFVDVGCTVTVRGQSEWVPNAAVYGSGNDVYTLKVKRLIHESRGYKVSRRLHPCVPDPVNYQAETILAAMGKFPEYYRAIEYNFESLYALARRQYRFAGVRQILAMKLEIRRYHHFSAIRFCIHVLLQYGFAARAQMMRVLRARKADAKFSPCPSNIADFSQSCSTIGPKPLR